MPFKSDIINNAIDLLRREGIIFESNTELGRCLISSKSRKELIHILKEDFGNGIDCQSLCITSQGNYSYYIFNWDIIEANQSSHEFYKDAIRAKASIFYGVSEDEISFDFM